MRTPALSQPRAHSRCPSPFWPIVSMQTLSTIRPVTVTGLPLAICAPAPVTVSTTNIPASAPARLHTYMGPSSVIVSSPAPEEPGASPRYSHSEIVVAGEGSESRLVQALEPQPIGALEE